ncbi:MAG: PadR family transcriptional regulator [Acidobacteriaceae bacterium]|nr:PadR family transcriptional regulator [Acidobacteriaceae bacterium]
MADNDIDTKALQKSSAAMVVLALLDERSRHGYELAKLIESRSAGKLEFHVASLYPILYRLENNGWVEGRWVERPNERRKRFYRITAKGRKVLAQQRQCWRDLFTALDRIAGLSES